MPIRYVMIVEILKRIEAKKQQLDSLRPLPAPVVANLRQYFSVEWTYNSNAIEGNTLTLKETRLVLEQGVTISGKSLREHFEAKNHERAIEYLEYLLQKEESKIAQADVLELHKFVMQGIDEQYAGKYRTGQVQIAGASFQPPMAIQVEEQMQALLAWAESPNQQNVVGFASYLHHKFVWIHPFFDGNGRTGRLLMNLALMQQGYPPAIVLKNDRKKYYAALSAADGGDTSKLELLIAQAIERSLDLYLDAMTSTPEDEWVLLRVLAENSECEYSQEYLSLLARKGLIDAHKKGRSWYSNLSSVKRYRLSKE